MGPRFFGLDSPLFTSMCLNHTPGNYYPDKPPRRLIGSNNSRRGVTWTMDLYWYCWWFRNPAPHHLIYYVYILLYRVFYIAGGARFLNHQCVNIWVDITTLPTLDAPAIYQKQLVIFHTMSRCFVSKFVFSKCPTRNARKEEGWMHGFPW